MQLPEELSASGSGDRSRLPSWLRWTLPVLAVIGATVVLGSPMLYYTEDTGETGGVDQVTPTVTPSPTTTAQPVRLVASGPLAALPSAAPGLALVGRSGPPSAGSEEPRYVAVSGASVRPLTVPEGVVVPADDGQDLLVVDSGQRLYSVPLDRVGRFIRLGNAVSVLGSRGKRVYVTFAAEGAPGLQVRVLGRDDGEIVNRRYLPLARGESPVGIVDAGNTVAVVVRTRGSATAGTLVLRWIDGQQVLLTRNGRFLGATAGTAVVRPGPDECAPPARLCLLMVRPGPLRDVRRSTVVAPGGWTPELGGVRPVVFARGVVVFPVRSTTGTRALAAAVASSPEARLVPGSRDLVPGYGVISNGRFVVWGVETPPRRFAPVYWDASRPALPGRRLASSLQAPFQLTCACP